MLPMLFGIVLNQRKKSLSIISLRNLFPKVDEDSVFRHRGERKVMSAAEVAEEADSKFGGKTNYQLALDVRQGNNNDDEPSRCAELVCVNKLTRKQSLKRVHLGLLSAVWRLARFNLQPLGSAVHAECCWNKLLFEPLRLLSIVAVYV